jgi:hypothetical protein
MSDEVQDREAAEAAAQTWLASVDRGDAAASYDVAAALFRAAVTPEVWAESLRRAQLPIGRAVARKPSAQTYATELPGAPDGEYLVLQYDTQFERKQNGAETVVMMREASGEWRVSGYWIR